ncbi:hypothetical protein Vadar_015656 [Vaccinium darrowii]|uniref:Uncharacterized protein n=1 Tax=Vaccinium darrowii TaxID=229202 RepID=A0ACB7ZCX5_9ERIC|nr:hypothetical protein Vadar_015656 [Vaccinium darrowii]
MQHDGFGLSNAFSRFMAPTSSNLQPHKRWNLLRVDPRGTERLDTEHDRGSFKTRRIDFAKVNCTVFREVGANGPQTGEGVSMGVVLPADLLKRDMFEVRLQSDHLGDILVHPGVLSFIVTGELVDYELGVAVDLNFFGPHVLSEPQASKQSFVLGFVIGDRKADAQGTLM